MAEYKTKLLIIGSGPAGYTAGIYAARAGLKPILVSGQQIGGQLTITSDVENFPGFAEPIAGTELMHRMRLQAHNVGVEIIDDHIVEADFSQRPFICSSENNNIYSAQSIIICTGASARWLNLESENKYRGFGVSGCATCDGFFYRGRNVAVVGGGNTAAEEALFLSNFTNSVTLIHRRNALRADQKTQEKLLQNNKINIEWDSVVEEILGSDNPLSVTGLTIKNVKTDKRKKIKVDGIFIAIGHHPNTDIFKNQLDLTPEGYIITAPNSCQTSIKGIFAAGDVQNPQYRQAIIAAGSGCLAALEADKFLNEN
ncbi:MAG: thioredoxin-disulfide reductase [Alphaproteobacteria bacterium]|nr:thioredoxin-disulfide reductase [Alphaproteobacteria bacterium]